jgi:hypothetical protein
MAGGCPGAGRFGFFVASSSVGKPVRAGERGGPPGYVRLAENVSMIAMLPSRVSRLSVMSLQAIPGAHRATRPSSRPVARRRGALLLYRMPWVNSTRSRAVLRTTPCGGAVVPPSVVTYRNGLRSALTY